MSSHSGAVVSVHAGILSSTVDNCTGTVMQQAISDSVAVLQPADASPVTSDHLCASCESFKVRCDKLQRALQATNRTCASLRKKYRSSLRKIRKLRKAKTGLGTAVNKFLNRDQQLSLTRTSTRGVKWSPDTVKKALQPHFACGPTGYDLLLSQNYPLPSLRTLRRNLQCVKFDSGVLCEVFQFLSIKVATMHPLERECCLTLDEMSITSSVEYDSRIGRFLGDATLPEHTGVATHCLVFMIAGITTRWKQTVAYYYTSNSTNGRVFAGILLDIIRRCHAIGLNVAAVTCDMGGANRAMWKELGVKCGREAETVNSFCHPCDEVQSVCVLADVPHVIKNVRTHLVKGQDIHLPQDIVDKHGLPRATVSVEPLKRLVEYQKDKDLKPAPSLTAKHLDPSHFDKMKVSHAMNIFSTSVSSALRLMVESCGWEVDVLTTAWFLRTMNRWFNLMSSRHPVMAISKFDSDKYAETVEFLKFVVFLLTSRLNPGLFGKFVFLPP